MTDRRPFAVGKAAIFAAALFALSLPPASALAQFGARAQFGNGQTRVENVFLPAPRNLRQMLNAAEEAIDDERYSEAATLLGSVLSRAGSEDYFIDPPSASDELEETAAQHSGNSSTRVSLKTETLRLLARMPALGLRSYELQFGAEAQVLLEEAVAAGDIEKLIEVTRRFPLTRAGDSAMVLLGQYYLDHGQPLAGALCFEKASRSIETLQQNDPQLSVSQAICWRRAGYPEKALAVLVALHRRSPNTLVRVGDEEHRLFANPSEGLNWLDNLLGGVPTIAEVAAPQREWRMFRGTPSRNGLATGGAPLGSFRWRLPLTISRTDEDILLDLHSQYDENNKVSLPALHALAVDEVILVRDPEQLWAIDFATGKRLWSYPWDPDEDSSGASRGPGSQGSANSPRMQELHQRMWEDAAYGQISSDGESVFLVDDLGYAGNSQMYAQIVVQRGGFQQVNPNLPKDYNQLVALDIERQGAIRWVVGGPARLGQESDGLSGAFFLGPPLPVMGKLYVMIEINSEIRLVVLSARTGELEWSQQLAHVENSTILNDVLRRLAGASPSFADGVIVCPTTTGAVVAVDVANRSLLWGFQYERSIDILRQQQIVRAGAMNASQGYLSNTWNDATVTLDQGRVLITPLDGDKLYALDLLSGEVLWDPRPRDGLSFTACIHDGKAIMAGDRGFQAIDMTDGSVAWEQNLPDGALPSGRGLLCENSYLIPTNRSKIYEIDLGDGSIVETIQTPAVLGNLIAYRGEIISVGSVSLGDSRYKVTVDSLRQVEPLRDDVSRRLQEEPTDVWALARQGELLHYDGNTTEALATFQQAYDLAVENAEGAEPFSLEVSAVEETRRLLVAILLEELEQDFQGNRELAVSLRDVIDDPLQHRLYLRLMAAGSRDQGLLEEAFAYFIQLVELEESAPAWVSTGGELGETMLLEDNLRLSTERWVEEQVQELLADAESPLFERMQAAIDVKLEEIAADPSLTRRLRWAGIFREHPRAREMNLALAEELLKNDANLNAELLLGELATCDDPQIAARATLLLARISEQAGYSRAASLHYQRLLTAWADVEIENGATSRELVATIDPESPVGACLQWSEWPDGQVYASDELDSHGLNLGSQPYFPVPILQRSGPTAAGLSFVFDQQTYTLYARDWRGEQVRTIPLNTPRGVQYPINFNYLKCELHGHLLILSLGMEVLAIDLLADSAEEEAILWRFDLSSFYNSSAAARVMPQSRVYQNPWIGQVTVPIDLNGRMVGQLGPLNAHAITMQRGSDLFCVDPLTGAIVWTRRDIEAGSSLFGDEEFIVVASPSRSAGRVLRAYDGTEAGIRDVRHAEQRWHTHGRNFLTWDPAGEEVTLRMVDPWAEEDVWAYTVESDSRGCIVEDRWVAVLQPNGKFALLSLDDGSAFIEEELEAEPLRSISVLATGDQFLLLTDRNYQTATPNMRIEQAPRGTHASLHNGLLYAFDRETGKSLWQTPARIDQYSVPSDQPEESPLLFLMRHVTRVRGNERESTSEVIAIDKRDGRQVFAEERIPTAIAKYEVITDPQAGVVSLRLPNKSINLRMTDDPTPPAPTLQTGDAASEPPSG